MKITKIHNSWVKKHVHFNSTSTKQHFNWEQENTAEKIKNTLIVLYRTLRNIELGVLTSAHQMCNGMGGVCLARIICIPCLLKKDLHCIS